jgi:hypothetical protein
VRRFSKGSKGIASIMDAFMFLLAAIALSSFLLGNQEGSEGIENDQSQELVDRTHTVLASMTLKIPAGENQQSDPLSIELVSLIQPLGGSNQMVLPVWAIPEAQQVISELLGPGWGFDWKIEVGDTVSCLVIKGDPLDANEVFASSIEGESDSEEELRFILSAWRE